MRDFNTAPDFDFFEDEPNKTEQVTRRSRANVPPSYKVMGEDAAALPVPIPPPPLPNMPPRRATLPMPNPQPAALPVPGIRRPPTAPVPTLRPQTRPQPQPRPDVSLDWLSMGKLKLAAIALGVVLACFLAYLLISTGLKAWQTWQDDLAYGRPRTMQLDQFVGHNEQDGTPSHFIAQNNNRQITVIEYPGGDVSKTRVFPGPRLFGKESELVPVKLRFEDVNGDNHVDMLLSVDNQLVIYINENSTFRPITGEERGRLKLKNGGEK